MIAKSILPACFAALALTAATHADINWDGDNALGNMSYNDNWYGNSQPGWGFASGNLVFNYKNGTQTSIYYDYGDWRNINDIIWETTFPAGLPLDGNTNGINFNQRLENRSSYTQTVNMNLSGAKNGATQIELNPVNGNLVINGTIHNDNSKPYAVYGNTGKTLTLNSTLGVGSSPSSVGFTIAQNSNVVVAASQSYSGNTTISAGSLTTTGTGTLGGGSYAANISIASGSTFTVGTTADQLLSGTISGSAGSNLIKDGSGTLTLTGTNTSFQGTTTIKAGTVVAGNVDVFGPIANPLYFDGPTATLKLSGTVNNAARPYVMTQTGIIDTAGYNLTHAGIISGPGGLTKTGTGTLTLESPANTYGGTTTVQAGTLKVNSKAGDEIPNTGLVDVASGAQFLTVTAETIGALSGAGTVTLESGADLTLAGPQTTTFSGLLMGHTGQGNAASFVINGGGTLNLTTTSETSDLNGNVTIANNSTISIGVVGALGKRGTARTLILETGGTLRTTGTSTTPNHLSFNTRLFQLGLGNSSGVAGTIDVQNTSIPTAIVAGITNKTGVTTSGALVKTGPGTLVLSGTNTYNGNTTIHQGTLALSGSGSIASSPVITVGDAGSSGTVLDVSGLTSGTNPGDWTLGSGQTLKGIGTVTTASTGMITIAGTHSPGNSAAIQQINGSTTYASTSIFVWELYANTTSNSPVVYDQVNVNGSLTIADGALFNVVLNDTGSAVNLANAFWQAPQQWQVFSSTGNLTYTNGFTLGTVASNQIPVSNYGSFSFTYTPGKVVNLNWTPVPELSNLLVGGLLAAGLLLRRRATASPNVGC